MIDGPAVEIPEDKLAYIAGYLDGEGCFSYRGSPRVYVSNTHKPTLNLLQKYYGGTIRLRDRGTGDTRDCYEWFLYGEKAVNVTKSLLPRLREKQAQAAILLARRFDDRPGAQVKLERMLKELKRL